MQKLMHTAIMIDACILAMPYGFCSFGQGKFRALKEGGGEEEEKSFISLLTIASIPHRFRSSVASVKEDISEGLSGPSPLQMPHSAPFKPKSLGFLSEYYTYTCICLHICPHICVLHRLLHQ
jgi:hypothetical protein